MAFQLSEEISKEHSLFSLTERAVVAAVVGLHALLLDTSLVTWHTYCGEDVMVLSSNKLHIKPKFITTMPS